mmetsp:Transcript_19828/g.63784  ORF Transcript_19828/g.63784 Transcript_19828/m.63784 type:complete len:100 (+) Transcript_19828:3337-3636(+)
MAHTKWDLEAKNDATIVDADTDEARLVLARAAELRNDPNDSVAFTAAERQRRSTREKCTRKFEIPGRPELTNVITLNAALLSLTVITPSKGQETTSTTS